MTKEKNKLKNLRRLEMFKLDLEQKILDAVMLKKGKK